MSTGERWALSLILVSSPIIVSLTTIDFIVWLEAKNEWENCDGKTGGAGFPGQCCNWQKINKLNNAIYQQPGPRCS